MSHPVTVYMTSLPMQAKARTQQEYLLRTLAVLGIPFNQADCALDEDAKRVWRRKGKSNGVLPGYLVDGEYVGSYEDFEYAVEDSRLREFLGVDNFPPPPTTLSTTISQSDETSPLGTSTSSVNTNQGDKEIDKLMKGLKDVGEDEIEALLRELEEK
ncbi:Uncharacterized conserved protein [Phaffia rhodozyma]|uniref:Uncharacterized conserved protein n=1 Tax=Phaffia rhodozyma TaxID=264483 RepID=A0A0F7SQ26_PHARH|nr:Uncharacterized conserved protein [Phaffia rhodozyma]